MASRDPDRPNIALVVSDDQGPWAIGYANPEIHTPNMDRLAAEGTRLDRFFCTSPVCSPARASLMTGRIPSAHGIHDALWAGEFGPESIRFLAGQSATTDVLASAGWTCGHSGKWHLGAANHPQMSIDRWYAHEARGTPYWDPFMNRNGVSEQVTGYFSDVFTDGAIEMVEESSGEDSPFYLNLWYTAPHTPWVDVHPEEWLRFYEDCAFESCPQEGIHPWTRSRDQDWEPYVEARDDPRPSLMGFFAAVSAMDAALGRFLDRLDELALAESTLVLFMSDNGFSCGHNGIWGKGNGTYPQNMYENSVRVPCVARQPGRVAPGQLREELVSAYDVRPTVLEWVGVEDPDAGSALLPGRSFAPLLTGAPGGHDHLVIYDEYGPTRMVRTPEWKYVHRYPLGPHELYNLTDDPHERGNLIEDPACAATVHDLRATLADWFLAHVDPAVDGATEPITGRGQIGPVGPASRGRPAFGPEVM